MARIRETGAKQHGNPIETQQSGFDRERRSKGAGETWL